MIAPTLSIIRSNPYARPYATSGTASASSALRRGHAQPSRNPGAQPKESHLPHGGGHTDQRGEHRGGRVPADRGRTTPSRVVGKRPAQESRHAGRSVRQPLDEPQRRRRRPQRGGQERR